jgi:hypothetical protein
MGVVGQPHAPAALPPTKSASTHCTGGLVDSKAGLDGCGRSRPRSPGRPARSESLYRLGYSGPHVRTYWGKSKAIAKHAMKS